MEAKDVTKSAAGFALGLAMAMLVSVLAQGMYGGGMMGGGARNDGPVSEGWGGQVWDYAKVKQYLKASSEYGHAHGALHRPPGDHRHDRGAAGA